MTNIFCEFVGCIYNSNNDCLKDRIKIIYEGNRAVCVSYREEE